MKRIIYVVTSFTFLFLFFIRFSNEVYAMETMLRVALVPKVPPYQFIEKEKYVGLHIDMLNIIADKNNYIIEYLPMKSTDECLIALDNGEADIALGIPAYSSKEYKAQTTNEISQSSICMIASRSKAINIKNKKYNYKTVYEKGTIGFSFMQSTGSQIYVAVTNQSRVFDLLITEGDVIAVGVKNSLLYQLKKADLEDMYTIVYNYLSPIEYTMAVKLGDEELLKNLNNGLEQLRINGDYDKLLNKWIVDEGEFVIKKIIQNILYGSIILFCIILGIVFFNFRLNYLLKKQVNEKTKELIKTNKDLEYQINETRNNSELRNCIVENNPSGIIVFDKECKINLFNQSACIVMGTELEIGLSIFTIELVNKIFSNKKDDVFNKGHKFINEEFKLEDLNGSIITYRYSIYELYDNKNEVRGAILTIDDITKEVMIKEEIFQKEKNRILNQIIAGIAHEIRNPLMSIKTFAELIPIRGDNQKFQEMFTEFVPREVDRANVLIKNLIDYARPSKNNKEIIIITDMIDSCIALINPVMNNYNMRLNVSVEDGLFILADKNQIKQVLLNIILNGFQSMQERSKNSDNELLNMEITAWKDKQFVYIQIKDEGLGMSLNEIKKSTEPFFTTKVNGTGLGLTISNQYVIENDGVMLVESKKAEYTNVTLKFRR